MSLRSRIPEQLRLGDSVISISLEEEVGVFPTSDYILVEISPKAGKINVLKIAQTIRGLVRQGQKVVAIRGYGFKGIGLSVRIAHELKKAEKAFEYEMTFDTFDAADQDGQPQTSVQIVVLPPG
ncbi:MAG: hypothetical protein HXY34_08675 [Candidatus Thorarchaeota archaeon]|nr:hypothetical protein [Candidatus Thorarchaeota archaeon]